MSFPRITVLFGTLVVVISLLAILHSGLRKALVLQPGNTLTGDHYFWNTITSSFVEVNPIKLVLSLVLIVASGVRAETPAVSPFHRKLFFTILVVVAVVGAGSFAYAVASFLLTGSEHFLYSPTFGTGPLCAAFTVSALQSGGDTSLFPNHAPWLTYSILPLIAFLMSATADLVVQSARDFATTAFALVVAWGHLRFVHDYGQGLPALVAAQVTNTAFQIHQQSLGGTSDNPFTVASAPAEPAVADAASFLIGDLRPDFAFVQMLPDPLRPVVRPLLAVLSRPLIAVASLLPPLRTTRDLSLRPWTDGLTATASVRGRGMQALVTYYCGGGIGSVSTGGLVVGAGSAGLGLGFGQFAFTGAAYLTAASGLLFGSHPTTIRPPAARSLASAAMGANLAAGYGIVSPVGGAAGTGPASLPAGGAAAAVDPVAERRREKALAALDRKLAELRNNMKPALPGAPVVPPLSVAGLQPAAVGPPAVSSGAGATPAVTVQAAVAAVEPAPSAAVEVRVES